jgi:hypothetical protein
LSKKIDALWLPKTVNDEVESDERDEFALYEYDSDEPLTTAKVDPVFRYALKKVDFLPKYWYGTLPKKEFMIRQEEFNCAVDEYIKESQDPRRKPKRLQK